MNDDIRSMIHTNRVHEYLIKTGQHSFLTKFNLAEFVLKYGLAFKAAPLPDIYRRGRLRACYRNSALMSLRHGLTDVEGYASVDTGHEPTLHAWCVDTTGNVLDRTWPYTGDNSYFGVPISQRYLKRMQKISGHYGVIDMWKMRWPIFAEDPYVFLADRL